VTRGVNGSGFENETNFSLIKHFGSGVPSLGPDPVITQFGFSLRVLIIKILIIFS